MTVDEAIKRLELEKKAGIKNVIIAWWDAGMFDRKDDDEWAAIAKRIEDKFDWSSTHDDLATTLDLYTSE